MEIVAKLWLGIQIVAAADYAVPVPFRASQHPSKLNLGPRSIRPHFVPVLQSPDIPVSPYQDLVNVTRDLGPKNPSIQWDGRNFHYHFPRKDAGWISAFEVANTNFIRKIYFPRGTYWFDSNRSTFVDTGAFENLWRGTALEVFGDGDYLTQFVATSPITDGPMLQIGSKDAVVATMSWRIHGMHFNGCSSSYSFKINSEDCYPNLPRAEHNDFKMYDVSFYNGLQHGKCCETCEQFDKALNGQGSVFISNLFSSAVNLGLATVSTGAPLEDFNKTAGLVMEHVMYSTLSLRGLGAHTDETFKVVQPWNASLYNGWGVIFRQWVYANTITQLHCEGSGGCILLDRDIFENQFTSSIMSMMQHALITSNAPSNYNVFQSVVANMYPVKNPKTHSTDYFSDEINAAAPGTLQVQHMTRLGAPRREALSV